MASLDLLSSTATKVNSPELLPEPLQGFALGSGGAQTPGDTCVSVAEAGEMLRVGDTVGLP